ncbi:uncharacterized protein LOC110979044 [Acanthaster planci]|uniref:Uncharacterized protein LOC110979044 n=1 Tax=Acanthaster planci TaxID=133434 RepID=A0A8B7YAC5_ACAPL|nr:uncharacterized protein LOC110979044 [Acanthaster planci]
MKMIKPDFKNPSLEIDLKQENRMDCKISLRLCLLYVLFLLYVSGLVGVVGAQPTATAWIVSPERDQKIGGRVEMRCVASNLEENHTVEWRTENLTLRWGDTTVGGNDPRFMFETKQTGNRTITQEFNINDLQSGDDDEYVCNVKDPIASGGHKILVNITIRLRVYSSNESFPVCSPDGPITVDARTQLHLSCASDTGSPHIDISQQTPPTVFISYQWRVLISSGLSSRSLDLIVDVSDDNLTFVCTIQSVTFYGELPVHLHSCIIGPIHVVSVSPTFTTPLSGQTTSNPLTKFPSSSTPGSDLNTSLVAGASVSGVVALVLIAFFIVICRRKGHSIKSRNKKTNTNSTSNQTKVEFQSGLLHIYDNPGLVGQDNQEPDQHNETGIAGEIPLHANPTSGCSTSTLQASNTPVPAEERVESKMLPVYAKPNKSQASKESDQGVKILHPGQSGETMEQRYSSPVFDSTDPESITDQLEDKMPHKPIAKVPPMTKIPSKPLPYKPKLQRVSNPDDNTPNYPRPPPTHQDVPPPAASMDTGQIGRSDGPQPLTNADVSYAQISVPGNRSSARPNQDPTTDQPSSDHLVYADLSLQSSNPATDEDQGEEPVMYARVMKK